MKKTLVITILALGGFALAQDLPPAKGIPLDRFFKYPLINGRSPASPTMSPDGSKIVFGWNETGERKLDLWVMDFPGKPRRILTADSISRPPRQDDSRTEQEKKDEQLYDGGIVGGFVWSPEGREILFPYRGRMWRVDPDGKNLRALIDSNEQVGAPSYSLDGRYIGFMRGGNVFRIDRASGQIKQLTFISKPNTEVDGFLWSPDSKNLLVTWSNNEKLGSGVMMDFTKDRASVVNIRRNWLGEQSTDVQVGLVDSQGGIIRWLGGLPRSSYLSDLGFSPDGNLFAAGSYSADFQQYELRVVPVRTMKAAVIYQEKAPKNYIPDWRPFIWARDGKSILQGTDIANGQFGYRSVIQIDASGGTPKPFYAAQHDVVAMSRPRLSDRVFLVTMSRSPLTSEITVVEPNGQRKIYDPLPEGMATPRGFDSASDPLVSDDGSKVATMASSRTLNGELYGLEPAIGRMTKSQRPEFASVKWADMKEVTFPAPDGKLIHGLLITPPGVKQGDKRPAFISNMYANSAKRAWAGYVENYAAMELGMVVLQVDFRASWGYGGEFNSGYYKSLGVVDSDEAVAAKQFLDSLGYVNPDRVGVWGWSYGGYLTNMIMLTKPGVFYSGAAVASVTDWKSYNEWYTRRRLGLLTDKDGADTFKKTSPVNFASGLKGKLLLVHGMLDDNVLFADTVRLMQNLIEANKYFDLMLYPKENHGIGRDEARPHVFVTVMSYLWRTLAK